MNRVLKVFCTGAEQDRLAGEYGVIARYDGFVLVDLSEQDAQAVARRFPVEDITELYQIKVGDTLIDTSQPRVSAKGKSLAHPAYRGARRLAPGHHHYIVQFVGPIKDAWLTEVRKAGGEPRSPLGGFAFVVRADEAALTAISALEPVRWVGHLRHEDRISKSLLGEPSENLPRTRILSGSYTVEFFSAKEMKDAVAAIKELGLKVLSQDRKAALIVVHDPDHGAGGKKRIKELSAVHGVRAVRERALKRPSNDVAAGIMGTQTVLGSNGLGLSGEGEIICVCDTGLDTGDGNTIHSDFAGRLEAILSYPISPNYSPWITNPRADDGPADLDSGHGTHVAGSVLGDGSAAQGVSGISAPIRGLAHRARLVFQAIEQEMKWRNPGDQQRFGRYLLTGIPTNLATLFSDAYSRGARIHTNSWGGGEPGVYDEQCEQLDRFVWNHKDFCVLFANGNDGTDADGDGKINAMSVTSPATSKNCISVGASENLRPGFNANRYGRWWPRDYPAAPFRDDPMADNPEHLAAFSSRGPTRDGRIKPDVVAPGTFILSTRSTMIAPNNMAWGAFPPSRKYFHMGGTSMATPLAAGAVGLVREYLRTRQGFQNPSAALMKATLIAGAVRLPGGTGVPADNDQGFGRVNLDRILVPEAPTVAKFVDQMGGLRTGEVHPETLPIATRQTPLRVVMAYSDFPGSNLVNNLNLILLAPDGSRHVGNESSAGGLTMDATNNVEVVEVPNPVPGEWTIQVIASNVPQGPQDFALVFLGHLGQATTPEDVLDFQSTPARLIPDNTPRGIDDAIQVDRSGVVAAAKVGVDISHTFIGDLRVWLSAPDNQRVLLHDRSGGGTDNLQRTYDASNTPALADLIGIAVTGEWRLTVADFAALDEGTLERWKLTLSLADTEVFRAEQSPGVQIPDNDPNGIQSSLALTGSGTIAAVKVWVDITHTWVGDLRVTIESPSGRSVVLHDRSGGSVDNIIQTYESTQLLELANLNGEPIAGTWILHVVDLAGRDTGKLNSWGLQITP